MTTAYPLSRPHLRRCIIALLLLALTACVEEYDAALPLSDTCMPAVEGTIVSDSLCTFILTHTVSINADAWDPDLNAITNAVVSVVGDDGSQWQAASQGKGRYQVAVGTLSPDVAYHLDIRWNGEVYASTPARPLPTPDLTALRWMPAKEEGDAHFLLSAEAPDDGCFFWYCTEDWEINTPFPGSYIYSPEEDIIIPHVIYIGRGWCHNERLPLIGTADDYAGSRLVDYPLLTVRRNDNRFNTLYAVTATQRAVTRAEYEYEHQLEQQSYDMGGLFTPLPTMLPGNIFCTSNPSLQAIGYIGVSAGTSSRRLFVTSKEIGHEAERHARNLTDDEMAGHDMFELYTMGYRVHTCSILGITWTWRWCVDCSDPYWGATYPRPDFWPQDDEYER